MLLIFPPVAKPCEPPAGIAKLAGALKAHGISCCVLDANLEGLLDLLGQPQAANDTWTRRAAKNISKNIAALKDPKTYQALDRYSRAVKDINRVLEISAEKRGVLLGLSDYQDRYLSPVQSADLALAAEHPELNPFYPYFRERLLEMIKKTFPPRRRQGREGKHEDEGRDKTTAGHLIGFSLNYLSQALCTFAMIGFVRKEFPGLKIILGGGLVSSWKKRPGLENPFIGLVDHLIAGPGEGPLLDLLGVKDMKQKHYVPDYESLPIHDYLSPGFILPYSGSSGCYWNKCSFCPETAEDNPYVPIPAEEAMVELSALVKNANPDLVHLLDNSVSPALMRSLAENPLEVPWYGFARIGKELMNLDYCMQLKRSGCVMLKLGLESGDQRVLDAMQKGIDLETASQVLKNLHRAGIAAYVYLLFGTPAETIAEARKTLEFVVKHRGEITFLNLAIFNMPLCGKEAGEYETEQFYDGDLSLYTGFAHPLGWDRKQVRRFLDGEFKRHSAISLILKNDPPGFTSNHAAFFLPR
ncbi:MAG TPA: radical SAM protein [Nitrospirota bacterium]|nr:radical SAM protein [Nitrospirota bacterium]